MNFNLTDASIISISTHCTGLQSMKVSGCEQLADASIISIAVHCARLQSLFILLYSKLTDASIVAVASHCSEMRNVLFSFDGCQGVSESLRTYYHSISELRIAVRAL